MALHRVARHRLLSRVLTLSLLFLLTAIIPAIALALLRMEVTLVAITCLQLVNALLQLAKVKL